MPRPLYRALLTVALSLLSSGCLYEGTPPTYYDAGVRPPPDGGAEDASPARDGGPAALWCDDVACGMGTCDEAARRCDCDAGFAYDGTTRTCVADRCGAASCAADELCDPLSGDCVGLCTPDRVVGDFSFCATLTDDSYVVVVRYDGAGTLDIGASEILLNGAPVDLSASFHATTQTFAVHASGLTPTKYTYLFRMRTSAGADVRPLFIPMWIGAGVRYGDFTWRDAILYQIFTDRFDNGDPTNDLDNSSGDLARVTDPASQWQGGDFAGITARIRAGYFDDMGVNALWISSPILQSHRSQPAVDPADTRRFASYHGYHPVATGYTHLNDYGYENPIEPAFGTRAELHELVNTAHEHGIRIIPDFVANHVQREARLFADHEDWFFPYNPCHNRWDVARIGCWFTSDMPDFDYGANPAAIQVVVDHALWMVQEFNFDGFRADALKHMDDAFTRALRTAVIDELETRVVNHDLPDEPTVFYMVGESLGGWARYHTRADMVQGQVDEYYYETTRDALLRYSRSVRDLEGFAIGNDTAYLTEQPNNGGAGGFPGAVMGNFFGNHDQVRALTEAGGSTENAYRRLRLAQTFLMTSPLNIPMLYQGDDIGTEGGPDPDNRRFHRFTGLSGDETASLENVRRAGLLREAHVALRRGRRETVLIEDWFWVYRATSGADEVYVAINRDADKTWSPPAGFSDGLGNCAGGNVPSQSSCIFTRD